jgi:hypothetical protein
MQMALGEHLLDMAHHTYPLHPKNILMNTTLIETYKNK